MGTSPKGLIILQKIFSIGIFIVILLLVSNTRDHSGSEDAGFAFLLIGIPVLALTSIPLALRSLLQFRFLGKIDWAFLVTSILVILSLLFFLVSALKGN